MAMMKAHKIVYYNRNTATTLWLRTPFRKYSFDTEVMNNKKGFELTFPTEFKYFTYMGLRFIVFSILGFGFEIKRRIK